MEIKGVNKGYFSRLYGDRKIREGNASADNIPESSDKIDISSQAKEMQKLVQDSMEMDDVRTTKVERLKEKIESGEYYVPTKKLAAAIIKYLGWIGR